MQTHVVNEEHGLNHAQKTRICHGESRPKFRMIALDLDGTLLTPDHKISDETAEYLRSLHEKGLTISIATGRSPASTFDIISHLGLTFPTTRLPAGFPLVCLNGARGMEVRSFGVAKLADESSQLERCVTGNALRENDMVDAVELFHEPVPRFVTLKALRLAKELDLVTNYYLGHEIYAHPTSNEHNLFLRKYTELTGKIIVQCDDYESVLSQCLPSKLVVFCDTARLDDICFKLKDKLEGEAHVVRGSPPWFIEILNKNVNKGKGLELMCKRLGIGLDETVAFGDGDNDKEFLSMAGRGIAMKNARDVVKEVADEVTEWTNAEDGVMRTLQRMENEGQFYFDQGNFPL